MLSDEKILITGPAGQIALPLVKSLATNNEVWGIARFNEPNTRERVESLGVTTRAIDLATGDYSSLPDDFTYVLHLAAFKTEGLNYDWAISVNAEGTGLLLKHCQRAKAALIMSTQSVYKPVADPLHAFSENDPLGDVNYVMSPTYSISKIAEEAVARFCARAYNIPVTIARMNASYGPNGGLPTYHLDWVLAMLKTGKFNQAFEMSSAMLKRLELSADKNSPRAAIVRAFEAASLQAEGKWSEADVAYKASIPILIDQARNDAENDKFLEKMIDKYYKNTNLQ